MPCIDGFRDAHLLYRTTVLHVGEHVGEMHSGAGLVYRDALHTLMHIEMHSGYSKVSIEVEQ